MLGVLAGLICTPPMACHAVSPMQTETDAITATILNASIEIHRELGPGLLESVYEHVLAAELIRRGFHVERQKPVTFSFRGMHFSEAFKPDLLVNNQVVVEIKSLEKLSPVHSKQLLTYLRLLDLRVGLLLNFGAATLREGIHRVVNGYAD